MGAMGMNAKKKDKRRRHAKARKAAREAIAATAAERPQPARRAPAGNR
jgi:hypothetical protein